MLHAMIRSHGALRGFAGQGAGGVASIYGGKRCGRLGSQNPQTFKRSAMLDRFKWPKVEDEGGEVVIRNLRGHGCHIVSIIDAEPSYEFSIGLYLNYGQAELIVFGLHSDRSVNVINSIRDRAAAGKTYKAGDICEDLLVEKQGRLC
jgi:hypothetical protein